MRSHLVTAALAFTAGVVVASPPWVTRYLVLGAVLAVLAGAVLLLSIRPSTKETPS